MKYCALGKTGLQVSEIGIGCEGLAVQNGALLNSLIDTAVAGGVNFLDLYLPNPAMRDGLGKALVGRRDKMIIQAHLCSVWQNGQYKRTRNIDEVKAGFEDLMRRLQTDYLEIGMIHYVDSMDDWRTVVNGPVMEYARQLKAEGKIGHIGLSSHNPEVALEAVNTGLIEVLMFSVNPCYDLQPASENVSDIWDDEAYKNTLVNMDPVRQELYETCNRLGIGISVMKAFGGGDLLDEKLSPAGKALTANQCIHYALTRPAVASVMAGARTVEELKTSIAYSEAPQSDKDYADALAAFPKINWHGHCMYCGHCAPCPQGIDIANVTKFLNLVKAQGEMPETVREHYAVLPHKGGECIQCGACEKRCPFGVEIIKNMADAAQTFGK